MSAKTSEDEKRDAVLGRMLKMPPTPHKPKPEKPAAKVKATKAMAAKR